MSPPNKTPTTDVAWKLGDLPEEMRTALEASLANAAVSSPSRRIIVWPGTVQTFVVTLRDRGEYAN